MKITKNIRLKQTFTIAATKKTALLTRKIITILISLTIAITIIIIIIITIHWAKTNRMKAKEKGLILKLEEIPAITVLGNSITIRLTIIIIRRIFIRIPFPLLIMFISARTSWRTLRLWFQLLQIILLAWSKKTFRMRLRLIPPK